MTDAPPLCMTCKKQIKFELLKDDKGQAIPKPGEFTKDGKQKYKYKPVNLDGTKHECAPVPDNPAKGATDGTIFQQSSAEFVRLYELLKIELAEIVASMKRIEKRMDEQMTAKSPFAGPDAAGGSP